MRSNSLWLICTENLPFKLHYRNTGLQRQEAWKAFTKTRQHGILLFMLRETSEYEFRFKTGTSSGFCMKKGTTIRSRKYKPTVTLQARTGKNRHMQSSGDFPHAILLLLDQPTVILAAVKDIFYIDRIILDLVKDKIPLLNKHLVIFVRRDIQFLKVRETLRHLP